MTDGLRRDNNSSSFLKPVSGDIHDERRFSCWQQKVWEFSWLLNKFDDDLSLIYQCTLPYSSLITHKDKDECTVSSYWSPGPVDLIYYNFFLGSKITTKLTSGFLMCSNNSKSFKKSIGCYISRLDQQLLYTIHWFSAQQKSVDFYQNLSQLCTLRFRKQFIKMFCRSAVHHDLLSDKSISHLRQHLKYSNESHTDQTAAAEEMKISARPSSNDQTRLKHECDIDPWR